jgi:hypothetical protein
MGGTKNAYFIFSSRSIGAGAAVVGTALVIFQIQQIILDHLFSNLDGRSLVVFGKPGDGSHLQKINTNAGVAINLFGDVVFHGETGGVKAVFTQNGLVAKVGDILDDGTTLWDIYDIAGVAINPYGSEVAFLGLGSTGSAVFVGQAPLPPAP